MTYVCLQQYWWFLVSLLGALLVFLMFVQGANSMIFQLGRDAEERRMLINSTGRKWEITFTTLVTFGLLCPRKATLKQMPRWPSSCFRRGST